MELLTRTEGRKVEMLADVVEKRRDEFKVKLSSMPRKLLVVKWRT